MRRNKQGGFTMTELIVTVAVAAIVGSVLFGAYRIGFLREAALSADARSLVSALNYARVRGLEDKEYARVVYAILTDPTGTEGDETTYSKVKLELEAKKEADLEFEDNDFVTFSGLDMVPFSYLNDMAHRIHPYSGSDFNPVQISTYPDEKWRLEITVEFPLRYSADPEADPPEVDNCSPKAAFMKCLSRASKLIIRKQSQIDANDAKYSSEHFFVYHDNQVRIALEPAQAGDLVVDDSIKISFDSMGYATRPGGYRLWLMRAKDDPIDALDPIERQKMQLKVVNTTPLGRTFLWKTYTKQEEEVAEGKEGL